MQDPANRRAIIRVGIRARFGRHQKAGTQATSGMNLVGFIIVVAVTQDIGDLSRQLSDQGGRDVGIVGVGHDQFCG